MSHPSIETHAPYLTIAEEESKAAKKAAREAATEEQAVSTVKGKGKEIPIEELWKPSSSSIPFWEACGLEYVPLASHRRLWHMQFGG